MKKLLIKALQEAYYQGISDQYWGMAMGEYVPDSRQIARLLRVAKRGLTKRK